MFFRRKSPSYMPFFKIFIENASDFFKQIRVYTFEFFGYVWMNRGFAYSDEGGGFPYRGVVLDNICGFFYNAPYRHKSLLARPGDVTPI